MDEFSRLEGEVDSLGIVFFANKFIRALDLLRTVGVRDPNLPDLCETAVAALHNVAAKKKNAAEAPAASRLLTSPHEIAFLRGVFEKRLGVQDNAQADKEISKIQLAINKIKTQKRTDPALSKKIDDVLLFFEHLSEEALAACRRRDAGETSEAEKVWQHYAMK